MLFLCFYFETFVKAYIFSELGNALLRSFIVSMSEKTKLTADVDLKGLLGRIVDSLSFI